ncbi:MAG: permease [Cyanobacteria bacterium P01_A01_bin.84]
MNQLSNGFTLFLSLLVEAMPFLLLGVIFSSFLQVFMDEQKLAAMMPRNPLLGSLVGSLVGFLFPVCECGNVPVARRLLMKGVPTSVVIGFLLAAPTINPIVIWSTWVAFRNHPEIIVLRVLFSLLIAVAISFIFSFQRDLTPVIQPTLARYLKFNPPPNEPKRKSQQKNAESQQQVSQLPLLKSGTYILGGKTGGIVPMQSAEELGNTSNSFSPRKPLPQQLRLVVDNAIQELRELGAVLVFGSAIAAAIQVFTPPELIFNLGNGAVTSIVAMMILATVVSVCSTVDSFFALSFSEVFTKGSLLSFLVFGPMIDLKGIALLLSIFKPKAVIYLFALAGLLTFLLSLFVN